MTMIPKTVREQVTKQIRDELVSGRFPAGSMLREVEFAARFGVSRGPVRDAFIQLSQEGYLAYQANRGVTVRHPPDPADRKFIASLRLQIETFVIKKGISDLSEDSIQKVESALEQLKRACDSGKTTEVALCDLEFHEAIMRACGGADLIPAWRQLCSRMLLTYSRLGDYKELYQEHCDIFSALQERKVTATIAALKANVR
jgi:DNA-binding GntR family transcriptional regulator